MSPHGRKAQTEILVIGTSCLSGHAWCLGQPSGSLHSPFLERFRSLLDAALSNLLWVTYLIRGTDKMTSRGAFPPHPGCDITNYELLEALAFFLFLASSQTHLWRQSQNLSHAMGAKDTKRLWTPELEKQTLKIGEKTSKW